MFCNLLGVSKFLSFDNILFNFFDQYADEAQQAFSADKAPTLYNTLPTIESLYSSWEKASNRDKYTAFVPALEQGMAKLDDYYKKSAASDAHIMAMGKFISPIHISFVIYMSS